MNACDKGNTDAINVLLNAGADPNIADAYGYKYLHYAVGMGSRKEVLQTIINYGADVNAKSKHFITALMIACHRGDTDAINVLLNAGTDPNITDAYGYTCLHNAVRACFSTQVLETIINHGADMNAIAKNHTTALMIACQKGNEVAIHVLMSSGANLNIADENDHTCLHKAVMSGCNTRVLQAMIDHGADVNATNNKNHSSLMIACKKRNVDAINMLLNTGADTSIVSINGFT